MIQPTIINLHPSQSSQELNCCVFAVNLDRYGGSCNTFDDLSNKVCVPNGTEDLKLHVFNMTTGINELKTLARCISWKWKCNFDGRKFNLNQKRNNDKCRRDLKNQKEHRMCRKSYFWNPTACTCKNDKYAGSIIGDSVVICNEIIEETKSTSTETIPTRSTSTKSTPTKTIPGTSTKIVLSKCCATNFYI